VEEVERIKVARCDEAVRPPCFRRRTIRGTLLFLRAHARTTDIEETQSLRKPSGSAAAIASNVAAEMETLEVRRR
jgi:hypothetical protein